MKTAFLIIAMTIISNVLAFAQTPTPKTSGVSLKSEKTAFLLSSLSTFAPIGIAVADNGSVGAGYLAFWGIYLGPAVGYFYGGRVGRGFAGIGIRTGALLLTAAGTAIAIDGNIFNDGEDHPGGIVMALGGLGIFAGDAIYDVVKVKSAVRDHNTKMLAKANISLAPVYFPKRKITGLTLTMKF